jgi:glycosyltransferase involved in cell wall biosynthesis
MNKFSIIVAVYNAELFIVNFMESLKKISYKDFEIIIIDGGSSDNTLKLLEQYNSIIDYKISEKDKGIYDAWNKGILKATGDWILFIGSDDILLSDSLTKYNDFISSLKNKDTIQYISSKNKMIDVEGKTVRIKGWTWEWPFFLKEMTVAHPGSIHSRKLFELYGLFDTSYKSSGDYEFLLRPKDKLEYAFMDEVTVDMREGGISDGWIGIKEHCRAAISTGGYQPFNAYTNAVWVLSKHKLKKFLRLLGINAYLRKQNN